MLRTREPVGATRGYRVAERLVAANDVDIWTEDSVIRPNPTILLVMGAGGQAILWPTS